MSRRARTIRAEFRERRIVVARVVVGRLQHTGVEGLRYTGVEGLLYLGVEGLRDADVQARKPTLTTLEPSARDGPTA